MSSPLKFTVAAPLESIMTESTIKFDWYNALYKPDSSVLISYREQLAGGHL
jgi:hypothetical protein